MWKNIYYLNPLNRNIENYIPSKLADRNMAIYITSNPADGNVVNYIASKHADGNLENYIASKQADGNVKNMILRWTKHFHQFFFSPSKFAINVFQSNVFEC